MKDYEFEERAAIRQYDGGHTKAEAERLAEADLVAERLRASDRRRGVKPKGPRQ